MSFTIIRNETMKSKLYIIGTGPGDPDLLTLKAVNIINHCPVIVSPKSAVNGSSTALSIIRSVVPLDGKNVQELHFPMKKIKSGQSPDPEVLEAWRKAAEKVLESLDQGLNVAFPTLGDPSIYSTGYYLYDTICSIRPEVNVSFVPGIPAMSACSASIEKPICLGDEMVAIIPATFSNDRLKEVFQLFDTIVLMKVNRVIERISLLLDECNLSPNAILVEQAGTENEIISHNIKDLKRFPHYFSTMIIKRPKK